MKSWVINLWIPMTISGFQPIRGILRGSKEERLALMKKDISENDNVVISGSLVDWGDELIPLFTLVIRLVTDTEIRIERIKLREWDKFGDRIAPGGDMYQQHLDFVEWARKYDTGSVNMRSKAKHDEWRKLLQCKQIVSSNEKSRLYQANELV
ncbi:MAG: hypothetical protein NC081_03675 [Roseburia sp.]|nr:hypothetical protein [Roseburia sp.]